MTLAEAELLALLKRDAKEWRRRHGGANLDEDEPEEMPEPVESPPPSDSANVAAQQKRAERAELKARILAETDKPGANASAVARAHGIKPHTVLQWRKLRDAASKRAAAEVKECERRRKRAEQSAKKAAGIAARSARQMERDRAREQKLAEQWEARRRARKLKTPDDVRREICSEDPDTLEPRVGYVESVRRGER